MGFSLVEVDHYFLIVISSGLLDLYKLSSF